MSTALTTAVPRIHMANLAELERVATTFSKTAIAPPAFRGKPADVLAALLYGNAVGLSPAQSLFGVQVVNGRPTLTIDAMTAVVRSSPQFEDLHETVENPGTDKAVAVCVAKRRGCSPVVSRFGVADAKRAGLWGGRGPWSAHPDRMLRIRARTFALRDLFADVIAGFTSAEEADEISTSASSTYAEPFVAEVVVEAEPSPAADEPQLAEVAATAIGKAETAGALESLRARVEERVLQGRLDAVEAERLVRLIGERLVVISQEEVATDE